MRSFRVMNLGQKDYRETYQLQKELVMARYRQEIPDTLILVEHPPVFTIGRSGSRQHLLVSAEKLQKLGIDVLEIDRGGDITYHGPGQIVGYPILDLNWHSKDLHKLLLLYEEVIIQVLQLYGLNAGRIKEYPGVWLGQKKIAALGIGVSHWVSYHGFALNINPNLQHYQMIIPCGISGKEVTSLSLELGRDIETAAVWDELIKCFGRVFKMEEQPII